MIIGGSKKAVIKNIQKNIQDNELNKKAEINDPQLSAEEINTYIKNFYENRKHKGKFFWKNKLGYLCVNLVGLKLNRNIKIEGLENLKNINNGAIVTSNHFNPLDNMAIRKMIKKRYQKNVYVVSQETNLAMPGFLGYLMNSLNIIPLCKGPNYIINTFKPELEKVLDKNNYVLIYPEEEMWFNYRKPRTCKRGAYQFAAEFDVPVISCFVEIIDLPKDDNDEFKEVEYVVHVLKPIYPDKKKSARENSKIMAEIDYKQKKEAYEKAYNKKLDYKFSNDDIAGLKKKDY